MEKRRIVRGDFLMGLALGVVLLFSLLATVCIYLALSSPGLKQYIRHEDAITRPAGR